MERNSLIGGIALLVIGLGAGYMFWGTTNQTGMMSQGGMMSQNIDRHFIEQMIPHHEGAIGMAQIAQKRSKNADVLALAKDIVSAQQKEINDMSGWYQNWYGVAVPKGTSMRMMYMDSMDGDTTVLESVSAADFDRLFIEQMIPHHEMAIMMARMLKAGTLRPEMKQLAANIESSQSSEIKMMREWLATWAR